MRKLLDQGLSLCHSCNLCYSYYNASFLTHWATRELPTINYSWQYNKFCFFANYIFCEKDKLVSCWIWNDKKNKGWNLGQNCHHFSSGRFYEKKKFVLEMRFGYCTLFPSPGFLFIFFLMFIFLLFWLRARLFFSYEGYGCVK